MTTEQNPKYNKHHNQVKKESELKGEKEDDDLEGPDQKRQRSIPDINIESNPLNLEKELDLSIFHSQELNKFIPSGFPQIIDQDGRIPLRRQIFNDKKILKTVLTKPKKGVYMCNHCDHIFNTFGELLDHFDEFNVKRPHKCSFDDCPWKIVGFNRIRQLHRHEKSVHSTEKDFKCQVPNCNKKFGRVDLLNRHIKSVHEKKTSRFNKKMSKDNSQTSTITTIPATSTTIDSPLISTSQDNSSIEESSSEGEMSPIASSSSSLQQQQQPPRDSQYKHTIKFLTNSDD